MDLNLTLNLSLTLTRNKKVKQLSLILIILRFCDESGVNQPLRGLSSYLLDVTHKYSHCIESLLNKKFKQVWGTQFQVSK